MNSRLPRPDTPLSDGVVTLREWRADDLEALVAACQDPEIARWTRIPAPYREAEAREFLARGDEEEVAFAVVDAADGTLLGAVGLREAGEHRGEVGYWVAAPARRMGVGRRALRLVSRWALDGAGLRRVQVTAHVENVGSQRTATSAGFSLEGVLRAYMELKGERHDAVMFSLLPGELRD